MATQVEKKTAVPKQSVSKKADLIFSVHRIGNDINNTLPSGIRVSALSAVALAAAAQVLAEKIITTSVDAAEHDERKTITETVVNRAIASNAELHVLFPCASVPINRSDVVKLMKKEDRESKKERKENRRASKKAKREREEFLKTVKELENAKLIAKAKRAAMAAVDELAKKKKLITPASEEALKKKKTSHVDISKKRATKSTK